MIRLRENFPGYRSMMLRCLKDPDPDVSTNALAAYETFLTEKDIPLLLEFQRDDYMSETSMNSPLIYAIRNQALAIIEQLLWADISEARECQGYRGRTHRLLVGLETVSRLMGETAAQMAFLEMSSLCLECLECLECFLAECSNRQMRTSARKSRAECVLK